MNIYRVTVNFAGNNTARSFFTKGETVQHVAEELRKVKYVSYVDTIDKRKFNMINMEYMTNLSIVEHEKEGREVECAEYSF